MTDLSLDMFLSFIKVISSFVKCNGEDGKLEFYKRFSEVIILSFRLRLY